MSKFKVGDRVRMSEIGRDAYENTRANPHNACGSYVGSYEGSNGYCHTVDWPESYENNYRDGEIEAATTNTLTVGQTYTSANGEGWECLAVRGDTAWMVRKDGDGDIFGSGWQFNIDGTTDTFGDNDDFRIVFEPVREHHEAKADTNHGPVWITYETVDGVIDHDSLKFEDPF